MLTFGWIILLGIFVMAWLVGRIVFFLLVGRYLLRLVFRKTRSSVVRSLSVAVFIAVFAWDLWPGYARYNGLCESEAGLRVRGHVEDVTGLRLDVEETYCGDLCARLLEKYDFVEMKLEAPREDVLPMEPGLYRFSYASAGGESCQRRNPSRARIPEGRCIAADPIDRFEARYLAGPYRATREGEVHGYGISSFEFSVSDASTGALLGTSKYFYRDVDWSFSGVSAVLDWIFARKCSRTSRKGG